MEASFFLIQIVIVLIAARVVGEASAYFGIPSVIGELAAGILIGPSVLGWVAISDPIRLLAQIGIILLLFEVGIETDLARLTSVGLKSGIVAVGGVILPFLGGVGLAYYVFGLEWLASLFVGSALTATSIGITVRVLHDLKKQNTHAAQVVLGAAVLDDVIGILMLTVLYEFASSGTVDLWNAGKVFLFICLFFLISPFAARLVSKTIKKWDDRSDIPGLLPTTIVSLILFFAWFAHQLGAPELLGGFAVGLALSRQFFLPFAAFLHESPDFSRKVDEQMRSIVYLFTPIFFVTIGLSLNLKAISWGSPFIWVLTGSLFVVAVIGKILSGFLLIGEKRETQLAIGTSMIPRGEVGLIFANVGLSAAVFKDDIYASLILVIVLTTLLAPLSMRYVFARDSSA